MELLINQGSELSNMRNLTKSIVASRNKLSHILCKCGVVVALALLMASAGLLTGGAPNATAACTDADPNFLSFPTWYRGLTCHNGVVEITSIRDTVVIVGLNVVDIILRLLSLVVIGFIIYGGIQYLIARGEPGNVAKAKSTITRAVVGLIIGIASSAIVGFITTRIN